MAHRLSKITTRTGDDGTTGLGDGTRLSKDSLRIDLLGEVDELNACLGKLLSLEIPEEASTVLSRVQHELFDMGAELCLPGQVRMQISHLEALELDVARFNHHLPPLREFILPGGHPWSAEAHCARTVCRRVERKLVGLYREESGNPVTVQYLNRLSDVLFVMARWLNLASHTPEVLWQPLAKP